MVWVSGIIAPTVTVYLKQNYNNRKNSNKPKQTLDHPQNNQKDSDMPFALIFQKSTTFKDFFCLQWSIRLHNKAEASLTSSLSWTPPQRLYSGFTVRYLPAITYCTQYNCLKVKLSMKGQQTQHKRAFPCLFYLHSCRVPLRCKSLLHRLIVLTLITVPV